MDLRRLRAGEWIAAAAGAALIVSLFGPWYEVQRVLPSLRAPAPTMTLDVTAFDAFSVTDVLLVASGAIGIALVAITAVQRTAAVGVASDALAVLVTGPIAIAALIRVLNVPDALDSGGLVTGVDRTPFAWLGLLAAFGVTAGALVAMRDERISSPGAPTDPTGVPIDAQPEIETLPAAPRGASS